MGLSSGGITGIASRIIHSGLLSLTRKPSTTFRRRAARDCFCPLQVLMTSRSAAASASRSTPARRSRTASHPYLHGNKCRSRRGCQTSPSGHGRISERHHPERDLRQQRSAPSPHSGRCSRAHAAARPPRPYSPPIHAAWSQLQSGVLQPSSPPHLPPTLPTGLHPAPALPHHPRPG